MAFSFKIDIRGVEALADRLERADAQTISDGAANVVNEVAQQIESETQKGIFGRVNLTGAYVKSKYDLTLASNDVNPRAEITVGGDLTILGRYNPVTLVQPGAQRRAGPVAGRRSAGVRVEIGKGRPVTEPQWFVMRLRSGTQAGDRYGVFVRTSASGGKPQHIYGPSPYSLFRQQVDFRTVEFERALETTVVQRFGSNLERALS